MFGIYIDFYIFEAMKTNKFYSTKENSTLRQTTGRTGYLAPYGEKLWNMIRKDKEEIFGWC